MILDGDDYIIRYAKMASRIDEESHTRFCSVSTLRLAVREEPRERTQRPCKFSAA
jgi:hypothetical protein